MKKLILFTLLLALTACSAGKPQSEGELNMGIYKVGDKVTIESQSSPVSPIVMEMKEGSKVFVTIGAGEPIEVKSFPFPVADKVRIEKTGNGYVMWYNTDRWVAK